MDLMSGILGLFGDDIVPVVEIKEEESDKVKEATESKEEPGYWFVDDPQQFALSFRSS